MDGVLTDISGLMTDRFYTYLTGYNKDAVVCCFKLGASIENTIPKQLLKFFGGSADENTYTTDYIILIRTNIKYPILKRLTLHTVLKNTYDIEAITPERFKGGNIKTIKGNFIYNSEIITKNPISKTTLIRNLGSKVKLSENILNILEKYEQKRLIVSYSDVITNSSTQVFFLDIEEKLINLLNENNITDKVIIINSKEDVIRAVEFYQKEEDSGGYGNSEIFNLINFVYEWYDMYTEYGKGDKWKELNDAGKTDREIIDFIWPLIDGVIGKVYYSFADDCGIPKEADILWENGYNSYRE